MVEVDGSAALVTGASSGIGAALAVALAARGCRLALTGRDESRLRSVAEACAAEGAEIATWVFDLGGRLGILNESAYSASKFALTGWTEAAAMDLWEEPVDVLLITPGAIDTAIWSRPGNDDPHFVVDMEPPETVAAAIIEAMEDGRFETYSPDLSGVVEFKTADIEAFQAGTIAAARPE